MTLLEIFFIISGIIIFFLSLDIARKEKFNALHFFVFLFIGWGLLIFSFFPKVLDTLGVIFWLQRWADVLVYGAIIFVIYMSLLLLSKTEKNLHDITRIIREQSLRDSSQIQYTEKNVILMRVYNEDEVLSNILINLLDWNYTNILIIDDGSNDRTSDIIKDFSSKNSKIISVRHMQNRWWGAALATWFEYIKRYLDVENIITFDADGQHRVSEIQKFLTAAYENKTSKIFFWSRFVEGSWYKNMPIIRKYTLKCGGIFTYIMTGSHITDPHNGFRLIKKSVLNDITLTADGMAYASELIECVMKNNISYCEVPVHIDYTEYSLQKGQRSSNAIFIGFRVIWNKFFK